MPSPITEPPVSRPRLDRSATMAGWIAALIGALALFGWVARVPSLTRLLPEWTSMRVTTALSFILSGGALVVLTALRANPLARQTALGAAAFVSAMGAWSSGEYALGAPPRLEQMLLALIARGETLPGRPPIAAVGFVCVGVSLLGLRRLGALGWLSRMSSLLIASLALLIVIIYAYGDVHTVDPLSTIPAPTAFGLLTLSVGLLCAWGKSGPLRVLAGGGLGSLLGRRALPLAVVLPLLTGWLSLNGDRTGLFRIEFAMALVALINTAVLAALIFAG
jgi:hypothetical protein